MIIDGEKTYLFNPWNIRNWTEDQIKEQVDRLIYEFNKDGDTMYEMSRNVEIIADITYLYGEMIARLTHAYEISKLSNNTLRSKMIVQKRRTFVSENKGEKVPAITFFESEADDEEEIKKGKEIEATLLEKLTKFKYAYESMKEKMNAIKKKMDAVRYEEFNK